MPLFKPLQIVAGKLLACNGGEPIRICHPCLGNGAENTGRLILPCSLTLTVAGMSDGDLCENCADVNGAYEVDVGTDASCAAPIANSILLNFCFGTSPLRIVSLSAQLVGSVEGAGANSVCVVKLRVTLGLSVPPSNEEHVFEKEIWRATAGNPCVDVDFTEIDETLPWVSSTVDFLCFAENATVRVEAA